MSINSQTSAKSYSEEIGLAFATFRQKAARAERWKRVSRFLDALGKRHRIEGCADGAYLIGNVKLTEGEIEGISRDNWNGTPEHADELVGDYLESVPA